MIKKSIYQKITESEFSLNLILNLAIVLCFLVSGSVILGVILTLILN